LTTALEWGGNVFVHEYGSHFGEFADGGSDWEALLNEYAESGIVQATANHNFAGTNGHAIFPVAGWATLDVSFQRHDMTGTGYDPPGALGTIRWQEGKLDDISLTLVTPTGEISLDEEGESLSDDGFYTYTSRATSSRNTNMVAFMLYKAGPNNQPGALDTGEYFLRVTNNQAENLTIHAHFSDDSGYSYAVNFNEFQTDAGTMAPPSTADSAISVGAYMGNHYLAPDEVPDQLRYYSGRGPRIDGVRGVDIAAPDDHYVASIYTPWNGGGNYTFFGGTSGALPQVAGAIALYKQLHPEATPDEIRQAIHASALTDEQTGEVPNTEWGFGRIGTHQLVLGQPPSENTLPQIIIQLPGLSVAGEETLLDANASSDGEDSLESLTFRWDLDYDGEWDAEQTGIGDMIAIFDQPGSVWVKMELEDSMGGTTAQLFKVDVLEAAPPPADPPPAEDAGQPDIVETDTWTSPDTNGMADLKEEDGTLPPETDSEEEKEDTVSTEPTPPSSSSDRGCGQHPGEDASPWMIILMILCLLTHSRWRPGLRSPRSPNGGPLLR